MRFSLLRLDLQTRIATIVRKTRLCFWLGAGLCLLAGVVSGFYLCFPNKSLSVRLEQEAVKRTNLQVHIGSLDLRFPPALEAGGLRVLPPTAISTPPLQVERLRIRPLWTSLFGKQPGVVFVADLLNGSMDGTWQQGGVLTLDGRGLEVALPLQQASPLGFSGKIRELKFAGAFPQQPNTKTNLQLTMVDCSIQGLHSAGFGSDILPLGTLAINASGLGNALRIESLSATGGALTVSGTGTILLSNIPSQSLPNLTLTLRHGSNLDPLIAELLPVLAKPAPDGSLRLTIGGTLAKPTLR